MILANHFQWIDPADAIFVSACRDALKQERAAYKAADAERRELRASGLRVVGVAHLFNLTDARDPRALPTVVYAPAPARHHNLFALGEPVRCPDESGFLLSDGSFADRKRAAAVAIAAGQIEAMQWPPHLYSEDLW